MRDDCVRAVTEAASRGGKTLTAADLRGIEGRLTDAVRQNARENPSKVMAQSPAQRINDAAERVAKDIAAERARAAQNVARQIIAHDRNTQFIEQYGPKVGGAMNALRRLLADNLDQKTNVRSLEQRKNGIVRFSQGTLENVTKATERYLGFWTDRNSVRDVLREMWGEDTGNAAAKKAALSWMDTAEKLRTQFNDAGGAIKKLGSWFVPQSHSQYKVAKAGFDKWLGDILPKLDRDQYVNEDGSRQSDTQITETLRHAYDSISTDGANQIKPGTNNGIGSIKNRGQDSRVLHFSSADAYMDYQRLYGEKSLLEAMTSHIGQMGKNIATLETFGPNGEQGFKTLLDAAYQKDVTTGDRTKIGGMQRERNKTETQFAVSAGKSGPMADPVLAHRFDIAKTLMILPKLGSATLSAITDGANVRMMARAWKIPLMHQWTNMLKAWTSSDFRQTMRANGAGVEGITHAISRYGEETFGHGTPSAVANTLFRVSGLNFLDQVRRTGSAGMLMQKLGDLVSQHETMDTLHATDRALLESRGVTPETFAVWKKAELSDGRLTPAAVGQIPGIHPALARDAMQHLVGSMFMDEGTVVPMMKDWARGTVQSHLPVSKRGTWGGEITNSILQFKSFPLAMISNHWQRLLAQPTPLGKVLYAAELAATSTILGAVSVQMKSLAAGYNPQDMTDPKFAARAFIQGGASGILGDVIGQAFVSPYKETLNDQLGPLISTANEAYSLGRTAFTAFKDSSKVDELGGETVRFVKNSTPFANLWYTKQITDHLFFQRLQDYFSPGYGDRSVQRAQKNFGSTPYWAPSSAGGVTQPQLPQLKTALGEP